ncbi:DUF4407 domain-containing protein [Cellulomonas endophytica]|uniref:DUF4407 domain-containing protein n=1 Tax=Cellulomonas endophytica TaxID=2494735 RepID=UPI0010130EE7|nr:DUF4407 domain-containing protein [Cellulomonas endophytica]
MSGTTPAPAAPGRRTVQDVLVDLSGADRAVLAEAPGETVKQAGLGGAILTTAVLAAVSATVALRTAVDAPWWLAVPAALAWGLAILNLDRWIVVSTLRQRHWPLTVLFALPRLGLAVLIGVVVSTPLTLLVFRDEIGAQLQVRQAEQLAAFEAGLADDPRFADLDADRAEARDLEAAIATGVPADAVLTDPEVVALTGRLAALDEEHRQAELAVQCEKEGTCGSGVPGAGIAAADKEARRERLAQERAALTAELEATRGRVATEADAEAATAVGYQRQRLAELSDEIAADTAARDAALAANGAAVADDDGLLAQLGALTALERADPTLRTAHWTLFGFLTALEAMPALLKLVLLLGRPSLFERLSTTADERVAGRARLRGRLERDEAQDVLAHARAVAGVRAEAQLDAETRSAWAASRAQADLAEQAVAHWRRARAARIPDEVDAWITEEAAATRDGGRGGLHRDL